MHADHADASVFYVGESLQDLLQKCRHAGFWCGFIRVTKRLGVGVGHDVWLLAQIVSCCSAAFGSFKGLTYGWNQ